MRLKITMHRCDVWTCMSAANACWIVLCKCMLDIKCSVLRDWSCAITRSFEFWLRTVEKMGLTLSHMMHRPPPYDAQTPSIEDIFLSGSEPKLNVVEPTSFPMDSNDDPVVVVVVGVYKMCDFKIAMHR